MTKARNIANIASDGSALADGTINYTDVSGTPTLATVATSGAYADVTGTPAAALPLTGGTISGSLTVNSTTSIEEVIEAVATDTSTTGTITFDVLSGAVKYFDTAQTADRTIDFTNANTTMAIGESMTFAVLMTQTGTAYYLNAYQVDSSAVTPKWQGGSAPTAGNINSIDSYGFTIIKTADATFTVLASQTQFA